MRYPKKLTSVRLPQAALEMAAEISPTLSRAVVAGLRILQDRYPEGIAPQERQRLHRRANYYDKLTAGSRTYTKIRIPVPILEWVKLNQINMTAACEFAILDAPRYR